MFMDYRGGIKSRERPAANNKSRACQLASTIRSFFQKEVSESVGFGDIERHDFLGDGVIELDIERVEPQSAQRIFGGAVFFVSDQGMADRLQVDAYLVRASCFEVTLDAREVFVMFQDFVMGDGAESRLGIIRDVNDHAVILIEPAIYRRLEGVGRTFRDGDIGAFQDAVIPVRDEFGLGLAAFGEEHDAAGISIESMHDINPFRGVTTFYMMIENGSGICGTASSHIDAQEAGFFFDCHDEVVFVQDPEKRVKQAVFSFFWGEDRDDVARLQGVIELSDDLRIVEEDAAMFKQILYACRALSREFIEQKAEELSGFNDFDIQSVNIAGGLHDFFSFTASLFISSS